VINCLELKGERGRGWRRGQGGEMTQTMYAYVNKRILKKEKKKNTWYDGVIR
jgi:hypothetical protein